MPIVSAEQKVSTFVFVVAATQCRQGGWYDFVQLSSTKVTNYIIYIFHLLLLETVEPSKTTIEIVENTNLTIPSE